MAWLTLFLKYETIDQDQISDIMAGALPRDKSDNQSNSKPKSNHQHHPNLFKIPKIT